MNRLFISILLLISIHLTGSPNQIEPQDDLSKQLIEFLDRFDTLTASHDWDGVIQLMDEHYRKEQLDGMLQGNKDQFIKEFYCGPLEATQEFLCPKPADISYLERVQTLVDEEIVQIEYKVYLTDGRVVLVNWFVRYTKSGKNYMFGLIGAVG